MRSRTAPTATGGATRSADPGSPNVWALGDYHRFAKETVWPVGAALVAACDIEPRQRVLDVAAGTGNAAIRAAEAGARVTAADLTPEHFTAGRREAAAHDVEIEWVEADVEDLPFKDGVFDVVTSCFGAMFGPHHETVADELVRVCRPGGTIAFTAFTPEGIGGDFFAVLARYASSPAVGASPPILWGDEDHVRALLGGRVASLETTRAEYVERAVDPDAYVDFFLETFGPAVALAHELTPARAAAFDQDLRAFARRADHGDAGGSAYPYEYLRVVARTPS